MKKKILICGTYGFKEIYELPFTYGFIKNNWNVSKFETFKYNQKNDFFLISHIKKFLCLKLKYSHFLTKVNNDLIQKIIVCKPDTIFLWRATNILPSTLEKIKLINNKIKIILYHNDNPYLGIINKFKNRHYLNSIKYSDVVGVYRPLDLRYIKKYSPKKVKVLKPNYITYIHKPSLKKKIRDVIFIGHYTNDREKMIRKILNNKINIEIFGNRWKKTNIKKDFPSIKIYDYLIGEKYAETISRSKITLCFLSKKNRDVYTRKIFEITACKSLLMAPKTKELLNLFKNEKEVILWKNENDIPKLIKSILNKPKKLTKISKNGYKRVKRDKHNEIQRTKEILKW